MTTIKGSDGHRIELQLFERSGEPGWLGLVIYGPKGGFRASIDLPPDQVALLLRKVIVPPTPAEQRAAFVLANAPRFVQAMEQTEREASEERLMTLEELTQELREETSHEPESGTEPRL